MSTTNEILDKLKSLTLLEAAELVSKIEETFGVDASAPIGGAVVMAAPTDSQSNQAPVVAEEKTIFDVILEEVPTEARVAILRVIRKLTPLSISEAKEFVSALPKALLEPISKKKAKTAATQLKEAGGKICID
uniref:Large ribosomal subunit protein bL12c n=1 Tax=Scotinosphaera sp. NIES-154 TaxID=2249731 RepID=A0A2Z4MAF1_9CHLO|nr:ribosomal protein L12 [Scotinosphaera sp. NIES-154]